MPRPHDPVTAPRRPIAIVLLAATSLGAAAIHFAAGPAHVEDLGDVGLAFYWTALFQLALGVGFLRAAATGPGPRLTRAALVGSLGITAVWAISRTVGLPFVAAGAESIGTADAAATVLQIATVVTLVAIGRRTSVADLALSGPTIRAAAPVSWGARGAVVAIFAVIALTSIIGVADATAGHGDGHGHAPGVAEGHASSAAEHPASDALVDHPAEEMRPHGHGEAPVP